jgi:glycosyltransferase involved in cell wall biosynthesis
MKIISTVLLWTCLILAASTDVGLSADLTELTVNQLVDMRALWQRDLSQLPLFSAVEDLLADPWLLATISVPARKSNYPKSNARVAPIRVLHYMGTNFGMTGIETFILQLCAAQKRAGLVPSIAMDLTNRQEVRVIAADLGITVHDLPTRGANEDRLPRKLGTAWLRARRIRALRQLLKDSDVLHVQAVGISCLDGFVAAALSRTQAIIVTHHGTLSWFASQRDFLADATFWIEKRLASRIVMPYAAAAAELAIEEIPEHQTKVIPFCVDEQLFSGLSRTPASGELTLVTVARMVDGKGHVDLLAALAKLSPRYPKLRAVFVGDGPTRGQVESEIDRLGLRGVVHCKGHVDHRQVPALMRDAHVVVLPSYETGEMFPLCLLEGMALGLPAIGTRWSGIPDIIEDGKTGILVAPRDENDLIRAIERFLADPGFFALARANALARVRSRFTATVVAKTYSESYAAALEN